MNGVNAELVTEFAKDKTWEKCDAAFKNQAYLFGEQSFRMSRCADAVDVMVNDSPLLLSLVYNKDPRLTKNFDKTVMDVFNSYNNLNYFVERYKPYSPVGRKEAANESNAVAENVLKMLQDAKIPFETVSGNLEGYDFIVNSVLKINNEGEKLK
jgi:hypothetical protein